jgi:hypothetical protein
MGTVYIAVLSQPVRRTVAPTMGPDHHHTLQTMNNLALAYLNAMRWTDDEFPTPSTLTPTRRSRRGIRPFARSTEQKPI